MREIRYRDFSLKTHQKTLRLKQPSSCKFELTFGCGLHCRHCYSDCFNKPRYIRKELDTREVKKIIGKIHKQKIIWLCLTGGDPLTRKDFLEIYAYAKIKGFLVSVFTSGYSLNKEILQFFKRQPPFVLEITLNAVSEDLYEHISQVKGSFAKVMEGIGILLKEDIPLKIKTQVTRDNISHIPQIRNFLSKRGLIFRPDYHLFARLNRDTAPCSLRAAPEKLKSLFGIKQDRAYFCRDKNLSQYKRNELFQCTLCAGQEFSLDPYGNLFLCHGLREPAINVLRKSLENVFNKLLAQVERRMFLSDSKCAVCSLRNQCLFCPGRAYLESGDMEASSSYYCELTRSGVIQ